MYGSQGGYIHPRIDEGGVNTLFGELAPAGRGNLTYKGFIY
jgi:hypothetical protein